MAGFFEGFAKTFNPVGALKYSQKKQSMAQDQAIADAKAAKTQQYRNKQLSQTKYLNIATKVLEEAKTYKDDFEGMKDFLTRSAEFYAGKDDEWAQYFRYMGDSKQGMSPEDIKITIEGFGGMAKAKKAGDVEGITLNYFKIKKAVANSGNPDLMANTKTYMNTQLGLVDQADKAASLVKTNNTTRKGLETTFNQMLQHINQLKATGKPVTPKDLNAMGNIQRQLGDDKQAQFWFNEAQKKGGWTQTPEQISAATVKEKGLIEQKKYDITKGKVKGAMTESQARNGLIKIGKLKFAIQKGEAPSKVEAMLMSMDPDFADLFKGKKADATEFLKILNEQEKAYKDFLAGRGGAGATMSNPFKLNEKELVLAQ